jgi:hypothetical protein
MKGEQWGKMKGGEYREHGGGFGVFVIVTGKLP